MPTSSDPAFPDIEDLASDEARMRQALGRASSPSASTVEHRPAPHKPALDGRSAGRPGGERPRKHFVQDGEVPVTVVNRLGQREADALTVHPVNRVSIAHAALANERVAREQAERSLAEAVATIHELRTKLGHAQLARQEASDALRSAREAADLLRADHQEREADLNNQLAIERAARGVAEAALDQAVDARNLAEPVRQSAANTKAVPKPKHVATQDTVSDPAAGSAKKPRQRTSAPRLREPQPVKWWLKSATKR